MTIVRHVISKGDTLSPLLAQLKRVGSDGALEAVDLTAHTVKFKMADSSGASVVAETVTGVSVMDASSGNVRYTFQSADVSTAGVFYAWFVVYSGSDHDTYPCDGRTFEILISDSL